MRLLAHILIWLTGGLLAVGLTLGATLLMGAEPIVDTNEATANADRVWARQWLAAKNFRGKRPGDRVTIRLTQDEASLVANEVLDQLADGQASVRLEQGRATLLASLSLPWHPERHFLNLKAVVIEDGDRPQLRALRIGGLSLPGTLTEVLSDQFLARVDLAQILLDFEITSNEMRLAYEWQPAQFKEVGSELIGARDLDLSLRVQQSLAERLSVLPRGQPVALADLIQHLMKRAESESQRDNPVAVNRAVILALAAYINGQTIRDPDSEVPQAPLPKRRVVLRSRNDLSKHFLGSAALALRGGQGLAQLAGWYKELSDADGGTGFSFADMAANRAGIRFAEVATTSRAEAGRIQRLAAQGLTEDDFMPSIDRLPEGLNKDEYLQRFGNRLDNPHYRSVLELIDQALDDRRLYRAP